jgi:hypothetical protein
MRLITAVHGWVRLTRPTPLDSWIDRQCPPLYELVICVSEDLHARCVGPEAMALEVPVATRVAGIPRLIQEGRTACWSSPAPRALWPTGDAPARRPALRSRLGQAGRVTIEARDSFCERMARIAALYNSRPESALFGARGRPREDGTVKSVYSPVPLSTSCD